MRTLAPALVLTIQALFGQAQIPVSGAPAGKSATPLTQNSKTATYNTTWAVVIGISDYQEPAIPDLRFADRDAEAFAQFLRSPGGGALDNDHLQVLTNEKATGGKVWEALYWLLEWVKEGDQAIIYFSGHGDVESRFFDQPGFLLCWDASPQAYKAGGALELSGLQSVISTLSLKSKARVLIVSDACHAGKLAGEGIGGTQATTAYLATQFANAIKILSCQPNEFSLEGEQWGGGRGVFSYHLVDGLYGLADKNRDTGVTLSELDNYLEERVTTEAAPQSQIPMVVGNKAERLATVNTQVLAQLQQYKAGELAQFYPTEGKGLEDDVLASVDSTIREKYHAFKKALKDKRYFEPAGDCADDYYAALTAEPGLAPLHGFMKRNYAAELQDDAQQVIKRILFRPNEEIHICYSPALTRQIYGPFPKMLERAATLLGSEHYMYSNLLARKAFFEGCIIFFQKLISRDLVTGEAAIKKLKESLRLDPNSPQTEAFLALAYFNKMGQPDSAHYYIDRAIEKAPRWVLPQAMKARFLMDERKFDKARTELDKMLAIDSTNAYALEQLGTWYFYHRNFQECINIVDRAFRYDSSPYAHFLELFKILPLGFMGRREEATQIFQNTIHHHPSNALPYYYMGNMYYFVAEYDSAVYYLGKAIDINPSTNGYYSLMGDALIIQKRYEEAEEILTKGLVVDSTYMPLVNALGGVYQATNRLAEAEVKFKRAIELDGAFMAPHFNLATVCARQERFPEALGHLEQAIKRGMRDYDRIQRDSALTVLHELPEYKALMKQYFPDKGKD